MEKLVYANTIEYETPDSLDSLMGPSVSVIELPRTLYWGPEKMVDMKNPSDVQRMYQAVVRIGTSQQQSEWLNRDVLLASWHDLVLPLRCLALWETKFPELTSQ